MSAYAWTTCTHPGCEVELRVLAEHRPNIAPTWRCLSHRHETDNEETARANA